MHQSAEVNTSMGSRTQTLGLWELPRHEDLGQLSLQVRRAPGSGNQQIVLFRTLDHTTTSVTTTARPGNALMNGSGNGFVKASFLNSAMQPDIPKAGYPKPLAPSMGILRPQQQQEANHPQSYSGQNSSQAALSDHNPASGVPTNSLGAHSRAFPHTHEEMKENPPDMQSSNPTMMSDQDLSDDDDVNGGDVISLTSHTDPIQDERDLNRAVPHTQSFSSTNTQLRSNQGRNDENQDPQHGNLSQMVHAAAAFATHTNKPSMAQLPHTNKAGTQESSTSHAAPAPAPVPAKVGQKRRSRSSQAGSSSSSTSASSTGPSSSSSINAYEDADIDEDMLENTIDQDPATNLWRCPYHRIPGPDGTPSCAYTAQHRFKVRRHLSTHRKDGEQHECECGKRIKTLDSLRRHQRKFCPGRPVELDEDGNKAVNSGMMEVSSEEADVEANE